VNAGGVQLPSPFSLSYEEGTDQEIITMGAEQRVRSTLGGRAFMGGSEYIDVVEACRFNSCAVNLTCLCDMPSRR